MMLSQLSDKLSDKLMMLSLSPPCRGATRQHRGPQREAMLSLPEVALSSASFLDRFSHARSRAKMCDRAGLDRGDVERVVSLLALHDRALSLRRTLDPQYFARFVDKNGLLTVEAHDDLSARNQNSSRARSPRARSPKSWRGSAAPVIGHARGGWQVSPRCALAGVCEGVSASTRGRNECRGSQRPPLRHAMEVLGAAAFFLRVVKGAR